ncbi:bZIP transcription factor 27-like [Rhodamnia argentea]|uniref:BZIP transcription factor 27-like n=1 Tax=Rhodamnia argentea TaxID=178133 RepID=A0A8B8NX81_9MYRT|nr:bZIP transcription factor 27-like [Rhodamnia argentea]
MSTMWSTPRLNKNATANNGNAENNGVTVVAYSSSSPLPFSALSPLPTAPSTSIKSMDDIWKDINLGFLKDPPDHRQPPAPAAISTSINGVGLGFQGTVLTNFLAGPARDYPPRGSGFGSDVPTTRLSLNSSEADAQGVAAAGQVQGPCGRGGGVGADSPPLVPRFSSLCGKGSSNNGDRNDPRDRKFKRLVKNRESAARSRARRQAYTTGLEIEIAHLQKENANLRRQQEKLRLAPPPDIPKKKRLQRTFTAPF